MTNFFKLNLLFLLILSINLQAQFKSKEEKARKTVENATTAFQDLSDLTEDKGIPQTLLAKAQGIVIFPEALKVALGVGGQGGRGLALIKRDDGSWSNPYFVGMGEANVGAQIGVQSADMVLLFKDKKDVMSLEKGDLTMGGDVGIAAGPVGRNSSASTDIGFDAEIYSYSKSKGLYIGISLEGTVLKASQKLNDEYYQASDISMQKVFKTLKTPYDKDVAALIKAIRSASK